MLDTTAKPPGFYDVLNIEDPGYHRSEALSLAIDDFLIDHSNEHSIVRVAAMAHLIIAYLREAPPRFRTQMTDSLLDDIRDQVANA